MGNFQEVVGGAKSGSLDGASNVEHGEAFGNDYGMEIDVAAPQTLLEVDDVCRLFEEIFSGFERAVSVEVVPEDECFLAANHPGGLEFGGHAARGITRAQHHEGFLRGLNRSQQSPGEPTRRGERRNEDEPEDLYARWRQFR